MYWLDTTILVLLGLGTLLGAVSGFLWQAARIAGLGVSLYAALHLNAEVVAWVRESLLPATEPRFIRPAAFVAVFAGIYLAIFGVTLLLEKALRVAHLKPFDRLAGAGFGGLKAVLLLGALCLGMASFPHPATEEWMTKSALAPALAEGMNAVLAVLPSQYTDELRTGLHNLRESIRARSGPSETKQSRGRQGAVKSAAP
jgi:membrane protein required for colicin V production